MERGFEKTVTPLLNSKIVKKSISQNLLSNIIDRQVYL